MPDDGHRYELIDGALIVTPAPTPRHQMASVSGDEAWTAEAPYAVTVVPGPLVR